MSLAESAVLLCLHAVRMSLLILRHVVVALFAFCACQCNLSAHDFHLRLNSFVRRSFFYLIAIVFEHKKRPISSIRPNIVT